jgi:8-oxo-dGDP phosphatase
VPDQRGGSPAGKAQRGAAGGRPPGSDGLIRDVAERWPVTESSVLAAGAVATLRRDLVKMPDGAQVSRDVVEHPGAVAVVAIDDADRVLLIRQYRHPAAAMLWEVPAGLRDVAGEALLATAQRELLEEAGYRATDWRVLADFFSSPGITDERLRVFLARNVSLVPAGEREYVRQHEEAYLTVDWVPLAAAVRSVLAGGLHNGVAIIGILSAYAAQADSFDTLRPAGEPENL